MQRSRLQVSLLAIFLSAVGGVWCGKQPTPNRSGHVETIDAVVAKRSPRSRDYRTEGTLALGQSVVIKSPIAAPVSDRFIATQQAVTEGQDLLLFNLRETELTLNARRSELKAAQAGLDQAARHGDTASDTTVQNGDEGGPRDNDQAPALPPPPSAELIQAKIDHLQNEIPLLEYKLGQSSIAAPFAGILIPLHNFYAGEPLTVGMELYRLVATNPLKLRILIPLEHAPYIDTASPLSFVPYASPESRMNGAIDTISPFSQNKGLFELTAHIDNPLGTLKDGQKGEVRILTKRQDTVLTIPRIAVITPDSRPELSLSTTNVFLIRGDHIALQPVKLGQSYDSDVEIRSGLDEGDRVALSNLSFLFDGEQVKVRPPATPPPLPAVSPVKPLP